MFVVYHGISIIVANNVQFNTKNALKYLPSIFYIIPYFTGIQMHVRSLNNGDILGVGTATSTSDVDVAHRAISNDGHPGLGQDVRSVHEGDQHDVHGRSDDSRWGSALEAAEKSGFVDCASGWMFA